MATNPAYRQAGNTPPTQRNGRDIDAMVAEITEEECMVAATKDRVIAKCTAGHEEAAVILSRWAGSLLPIGRCLECGRHLDIYEMAAEMRARFARVNGRKATDADNRVITRAIQHEAARALPNDEPIPAAAD